MSASSLCMRCLKRSLLQIDSPASNATRTFSTTAPRAAAPVKKKPAQGKPPPARASKTLRLGKKKRVASTGRPPAPGERRALSKRIVLSNTNALEVPLEDFSAQTSRELVQDGQHVGKMLGLSGETVDALRALEAFKHTQGWNLFRRPATLVRQETVELASQLEAAAASAETARIVLHGERGAGKSVLLLQGTAMAWLKGWIVVHFPEAKDLTNAHTSYAPVDVDAKTQYVQPHYTSRLLGSMLKANFNLLNSMRLSREPKSFPISIQPNISLARFAELGAKDTELAWPIWQVLWEELTSKSQKGREGLHRPPIYVSLDGLDHVMRDSAYLDSNSKPIHSHDLALVQQFLQRLSGAQPLPNGGAVLAAVSESNRAATPTLDFVLDRSVTPLAAWDPFLKRDERVYAVLKDALAGRDPTLKLKEIRGLSKEEAKSVMEYYARSGLMRANITDGLVSEKWTMSGGGIMGQLEKSSVRMSM